MRLRDSIHWVDQEGVLERKKGRLQRRVYDVQGPNHLWHIDIKGPWLASAIFDDIEIIDKAW